LTSLTRAAGPGRRSGAVWVDRHIRWLLVAPAVLVILAVSLYPLGYSVWVSLVEYDFQIPGHAWVGLKNFAGVVHDPIWWQAVWHTAVLSVSSVAVELLLGFGLALAFVRPFRGRKILVPLVILPLFISPVIVGQFWNLLLTRPFGPIDWMFSWLWGHPSWTTDSPWNYIAIILADTWQWTPFMFVILLAGLTSISDDLYEAADLDGALPWQSFLWVTMPLLWPIVLLAVTFRFLDAVKLFDVIYVLTGGGPGTQTYTASYYAYQEGFQNFHLAQGTAASWIFLGMITVVAAFLVRRLLKPVPA
jgi:multiple sugar transport system permease protein